ncbi:MAG: Hsp70 family protein, partial [Acholeplasmataceae bacterium]|nr:Hsp70 family protein [Acholeplasmataceae bacterium]
KALGRFQLGDIPPARRGVPQIEVSFDIDANGIVSVKAKDLGTNKEQKITISGTGALSKEEIDRMVKEAEEQAEADQKKREEADARNEASTLIFHTNKAIEDLKDEIDETTKLKIQNQIKELEEALNGTDIDLIKSKKEVLEKDAQDIAMKAYQKTQNQNQDDQTGETSKDDDNTVDAEFEEKN